MDPKTCSKCHGSLEEGFIFDHEAQALGNASEWYEGAPPERSFRSFWFGPKLEGRSHRVIRTYRCTECGYLESYAD
jgi:hypothetical protein